MKRAARLLDLLMREPSLIVLAVTINQPFAEVPFAKPGRFPNLNLRFSGGCTSALCYAVPVASYYREQVQMHSPIQLTLPPHRPKRAHLHHSPDRRRTRRVEGPGAATPIPRTPRWRVISSWRQSPIIALERRSLLKPDRVQYNTQIQPHNAPTQGVNLLSVYRSLLRIVAGLEEKRVHWNSIYARLR